MSTNQKAPYICGPLSDMPEEIQESARAFYVRLGDLCLEVLGIRAFVPCEHYDPIKHANFSVGEVYDNESRIVKQETSLLIVAAISPSWGGGMEIEMAASNGVPIIFLKPDSKYLTRIARGPKSVQAVLDYRDEDHAILQLKAWLLEFGEAEKSKAKQADQLRKWEMASEDPSNNHPLRCETHDSLKRKASSG